MISRDGGKLQHGSSSQLDGMSVINSLRQESFNIETEEKLSNHPYIRAAESGDLTMAQRRAFVAEQFSVQLSDAISFATLAGHENFRPKSLAGTPVPPEPDQYQAEKVHGDGIAIAPDLFHFLLGGEIYAADLLLKHAASLGFDEGEESLKRYEISPLAQAYPSYWARMALNNNRAAGAAACAVNFPVWGRMCRRLLGALAKAHSQSYGYDGEDDPALAFVAFFASPIENLDKMAAAVIDGENGGSESYEAIAEHVRLLQQYEVFFWDAVYSAS